MNPVVNGLQQEYEGRVVLSIVDIDMPESRQLKQKYGFRAQPYFVLLDGSGEVAQTWFGLVPVEEFRRNFDSLIGGSGVRLSGGQGE
jgi:thioredoxin-like negative regulator of GroEL